MQGAPSFKREASRRLFGGVPFLVATVAGCSFTDLDGFTSGGGPDASVLGDGAVPSNPGAGGDAGPTDESPLGPACGDNMYCALAPSSGWSFVAMRFGGEGGCPVGYGDGADLVELSPDSDTGSPCGCSCGAPVGAASCTNGSARLDRHTGFLCVNSVSTSIAATCSAVNVDLGTPYVFAKSVPPTQVTCSSTMQNAKPPPRSTSPARSCALVEAARSNGCSDDRRCIVAPSGGYQTCVAHPGNAACPRGYSRRRSLGTAVVDTRTCDSCRCETTDTCANPRIELFTTADCSGTPSTISADDKCKSPGVTGSFKSARYQVDRLSGPCKVVNEAISGSVSVTDETTVCCPSG